MLVSKENVRKLINFNFKKFLCELLSIKSYLQLIPVTTFALGCWQVKRKIWKEQLIKDMEKFTQMPAMDIPEE